MKKLIILILILILMGTLIAGCTEKTTEKTTITDKENLGNENWYQYTYTGPYDIDNSDNAMTAVNPYLIELGWDEGLQVMSWGGETNLSMVIIIPFQLTNESLDNINQTLENFSFYPVRLNEVVEMEGMLK